MSKTMKKILALLLAAVMMLSLVACGGGGEETQPQGTEGNQTPEETTEATEPFDAMAKYEKPVTLTVGRWLGSMNDEDAIGGTYDDNAYWDYIAGELNVNLEYELVYAESGDYEQALDLAITAGELPDAFVVMDYNTFYELASEGMLYNVGELFETYANDSLKAMYAGFADPWSVATVDGEIMCLPRTAEPFPWVIQVRQDWIDELGLVVDADGDHLLTLDEVEMLAREFIAKDPEGTGNAVGVISKPEAQNMYYTTDIISQHFGALEFEWIKNEDGTVTNGIIDPDMKDALAWLAEMYSTGLLDQDFGISTGMKDKLAQGRAGMIVGTDHTSMTWLYKASYDAFPELEMATYGLDDGTGHTSFVSDNAQNRFLCISKDCENPEAVIKVLNLYADLFMQTADYDYIDANYPEFKELNYSTTWTPWNVNWVLPNQTATQAADYRAIISGELIPDESYSATCKGLKAYLDGDTSAAMRIQHDAAMGTIVVDELIQSGKATYTCNVAPPLTETMSAYQSTLNDFAYETMVKIVTGELPVDYFDTFVQEWLDRGGQDIIDELEEIWK